MAIEMALATVWTFKAECEMPADVGKTLCEGEKPLIAYETSRDIAVITNKRLIIRNPQGLTGKVLEIYSLPWRSVNLWSCEDVGRVLDVDSELEMWTQAGHFKIKLHEGLDIHKLDALIATAVLCS